MNINFVKNSQFSPESAFFDAKLKLPFGKITKYDLLRRNWVTKRIVFALKNVDKSITHQL